MGNTASATQASPISQSGNNISNNKDVAAAVASTGEKPKCKACCACPETKKARDAW
jgi:cytochrome c oxidase assembly protein subunit 17